MTDLRDDCRIRGAVLRDRGEAESCAEGFRGLHLTGAAVCAIPSATGRQARLGAGRDGQHGRDQRDAEEEKQDEA